MNIHSSSVIRHSSFATRRAFTLIELLVVIAIIGILAALLMNLLPRANDMKVRTRVKAELNQVIAAIEYYKEKRGYYPPDNPANLGTNSLFYELSGTGLDKSTGIYTTLTGDSSLPATSVSPAFNVDGFVNANSSGPQGADDAKNFLGSVKANQTTTVGGVKLLGISVNGPTGAFCPWIYSSSSPTHNPNGFDVWVDVTISGRTQTFGNWKKD